MNLLVSNTAELSAALSVASAGDTIKLGAGDYSYLTLTGVKFAGDVTITSADPGKPVVIDGIMLTNCSGLKFTNVDIDYTEKLNGSMQILNSSNITLDGVELIGATGRPGNGLIIRGSDNVTVNNADVHDFTAGIGHQDSTHVTITNSQFHDLGMDGVRGGGSSWVTISGNTFTNFHKIAYAHNDAIQFWTSGTTASVHDLVITNNTITQGSGDAVQGIFMNNEMGFTYEKVTITGNAIIGPGYHGITVEKANNITIEGNLIEGYKDLGGWIQLRNSSNVSLQHNVSTSWKLDNNTSIITSDNKTIALGDVSDTSILNYWKTHGHTVPDSAVIGSAPPGTTGGVTPPAPPVLPDADRLLIGASGSDTLLGGSGNDTLNDGSGGSDNLIGGAGNDTYIINSWGSLPNEKADGGIDTVRTALENHTLRTNVENLTLTGTSAQRGNGNAQDNVITGNAVKNQLSGGDGNDTLVSIGGVDTLTGGAGKDVFSFTKIPSAISTITDFTRGQDVLDLRGLLLSYQRNNPVADGYVKFTIDGTGTTVAVDVDGRQGPAGFVNVVKLTDVTTALTSAAWVWSRYSATTPDDPAVGDAAAEFPLVVTVAPAPADFPSTPVIAPFDLDGLLASLGGGWSMA